MTEDAPMTMLQDQVNKDEASQEQADDLVFECELDASPAKVWRALTIPGYVAAWLAPMKLETHAEGLRFDGKAGGLAGKVDCTVLAFEPPHRLRYAWREDDGSSTLDSVVTFELDPIDDGGTHLRITHGDFVLKPVAANLNEPVMMLRAA